MSLSNNDRDNSKFGEQFIVKVLVLHRLNLLSTSRKTYSDLLCVPVDI